VFVELRIGEEQPFARGDWIDARVISEHGELNSMTERSCDSRDSRCSSSSSCPSRLHNPRSEPFILSAVSRRAISELVDNRAD